MAHNPGAVATGPNINSSGLRGDDHGGGSLPPKQKKGGDSRVLSPPLSVQLVTEPQVTDELPVLIPIGPLQVLQKPAPASHHLQEAATTVVVLFVGIEMTPEVIDAARKERNLHRSTTPIVFVDLVLLDDVLAVKCHSSRASTRA
jgi:hypothetical protein